MKTLQKYILIVLMALGTLGCSEVRFGVSKNNKPEVSGDPIDPGGFDDNIGATCFDQVELITPCLLINDSFERAQLIPDDKKDDPGFAWQLAIFDHGGSANGVAATIMDSTTLGEPAHLDHALYFTGRPGASVHYVHLMSKPFDLRPFRKVELNLNYLLIDVEGYSWNGDVGNEHLKIEICISSEADCVADIGPNPVHWIAPPILMADKSTSLDFNGLNHKREDWEVFSGELNLTTLADVQKASVMIRISAIIDEGFRRNSAGVVDLSLGLEDAIAIDRVQLKGY